MRGWSTPYLRDEDIRRMAERLATHGEITDAKAEALARAVHLRIGWAGTPVKFDDNGKHRPEGSKEQDIAHARRFLELTRAGEMPGRDA